MTAKQYLKLHPEKYIMVTYETGSPVYICEPSTKGLFDVGITDKREDAIEWSAIDNTPTKLGWYVNKTGYKNLVFEIIKKS